MGEREGNRIGIWMTTAMVVGTMVGAGIFMLPASLAPLGPNALVGWVVSATGALCIGFALSRLSRLGGDGFQANVERELGPMPAFLAAWAFWVSSWVAQAAVAIAGASALSWMSPDYAGAGFVIPLAVASVVLFTVINLFGARSSGVASIVTVAIKIVPLLAVIAILAIRGIGPVPYEPLAHSPITVANLATAVALTFFALTGFENATTPVGKVINPSVTIPRAIMGGTLFVAVLYMLASTGVQLLLPAGLAANSPAPFAEVISAQWGGWTALAAAFAIMVAAFGCLNALILGTGELGYALALRRDMPAAMARTWRGNTPIVAQIVGSALSILLSLANSGRATAGLFTFIVLLSTAAVLVVYLAGVLSAWRLSPTLGARAALIVALCFILFALYGSGLEADLWCLALLAAGLGIRALMHRLRRPDHAAESPASLSPAN